MEVVKQEGIKDCGVCCLLSIIKHYGGNVSLEYLRELTNTTKNGVSAYNLVKAATKIGFNSYGIETTIEKINNNMLPIISHVIVNRSYQHFIVIYSINKIKNKILIMDPAYGKKEISIKEFHLMTSNNYIYLKPIKKILNLERKRIIDSWLREFLSKNKKYIPYIILLTVIYFILNIVTAFYFKLLLNNSIEINIIKNTYLITTLILNIYILKELAVYLKNLNLLKWSEILNEELEIKLLKRLTLLPYLYYKNRTTGEIISRVKDLEVIKNFIIQFISSFFTDFIVVIIFISLLFFISFKLGLLVVIISIILFTKEILINKIYIKENSKYLHLEDKVNGILYENINSMSTIKSLHIEKEKTNEFINIYEKLLTGAYKLNKIFLFNNFTTNIINDLLIILLLSFGSILIIKDKFSLANLIVFQSILNYYLSSFNNIILIFKEYSKYKLSRKRIEDLFTINVENFNNLEYFKKYNLAGTIKIKGLNYSYGTKEIFKSLNLTIKKKDKIFLTGNSGIGKSTLMKILTRFINVKYGYITIKNIDLNHYHLDTIRNRIIYVSQNESLFTNTIKNNIVFNSDDSNIDKICKITKVNKLLDKNLGYSKMIEENGLNYSGGERQKIILARSIIKDADIYIFDEALNQIDIKEEKEILTNILNYLKDKTVIVISHRLTCQDLFNRVLVLEDGKIYEKL